MKKQATNKWTVIRKATCKSLNGKSTLNYTVSKDDSGGIWLRIVEATGGGFFNSEALPWSEIEKIISEIRPLTSVPLRSLFEGRSSNSSGYILAALAAEGLVQKIEGKLRLHS